MMHTFIQHDEDGETVFVFGHHVRRGPGKTQEWRPMVWWTSFFVSALLAATMLTILTATAAEAKAKKCKTLRLPVVNALPPAEASRALSAPMVTSTSVVAG